MTERSFLHELMLFVNKHPAPVAPDDARTKALAALKERFVKFKMPPDVADKVIGACESEQAPARLIDYLLVCPDREFAEHMLAGVLEVAS